MTTLVASQARSRPRLRRYLPLEAVVPARVEVLACGDPDRGDDGASLAALAELEAELPSDVTVRLVGQLDIDDLLAIPTGAGAVVVDTATGVDPGWVVEIPFIGFAGRESGIRARSSDALARPETVGLASMIRGTSPDRGARRDRRGVVRPGRPAQLARGSGLCSFRVAIIDAIDRVRQQVIVNAVAHLTARSSNEPVIQGEGARVSGRRETGRRCVAKFPGSGSSRSWGGFRARDEHRTRCMAHDVLGDRAEEQAANRST